MGQINIAVFVPGVVLPYRTFHHLLDSRLLLSLGVDVESTEGCAPLATLPSKIDLAVLNAGVLTNDDFSSINFSDCAWQFNTNALGPLRCMQELLPKLTEGSKVIIIGSKLGSFGETVPGRRVRCPALLTCYFILCMNV